MIPLVGRRKRVNCRALLDQGSQVSFVKSEVLRYLRYESLGKQKVRLQTYHKVEDEKEYEVVRIFFCYKNGIIPMECFVDDNLPECTSYKGLS